MTCHVFFSSLLNNSSNIPWLLLVVVTHRYNLCTKGQPKGTHPRRRAARSNEIIQSWMSKKESISSAKTESSTSPTEITRTTHENPHEMVSLMWNAWFVRTFDYGYGLRGHNGGGIEENMRGPEHFNEHFLNETCCVTSLAHYPRLQERSPLR